jgi:signal transduction histidine kinase
MFISQRVELLPHSQLIGLRLNLHAYVRYSVVVALVVGTLLARSVLGLANTEATTLVVVAIVIAVYNTLALLRSRALRAPERAAEAEQSLLPIMYATILLDYLCLTVAVWSVGGSHSPFLALYLLNVIVSCVLLSRGSAIVSTMLSYLLLASLVIGEWLGLIPARLPLGESVPPLPNAQHALVVLVAYAVLIGLSAYLLTGISQMLRGWERELIDEREESGRLSTIRGDFLRLAAHNLRSPVGASTLLLRNLLGGLAGPLNEKQTDWISRSLGRLRELSEFLRDLQIMAELQSSRIEQQVERIHVRPLLEKLVRDHQDLARERNHVLALEAEDDLQPVRAIPRLLREAVANYLRNAVWYTPEGGRIVVRSHNALHMVRIEVEDNGIGIDPEDQVKLFQAFVQIGDKEKPATRVEKTGLGLSIVRRVVELHGGRVGVDSTPGEGSIFYMEIPAAPM